MIRIILAILAILALAVLGGGLSGCTAAVAPAACLGTTIADDALGISVKLYETLGIERKQCPPSPCGQSSSNP